MAKKEANILFFIYCYASFSFKENKDKKNEEN